MKRLINNPSVALTFVATVAAATLLMVIAERLANP